MKRRDFLGALSASTVVPALPGGAASLPVAPAPIPAALYGRAVHLTRLWGTVVPEMFTSALGLDLKQAERLFGDLVHHKVIAAPNASGFARAAAPYLSAGTGAAGRLVTSKAAGKSSALKLDRLLPNSPSILPVEADQTQCAESPSCSTESTASDGTSEVTKA